MSTGPTSASFVRLLLFVLAVLLLAVPAWAQFDTAQVSGVIQDGSGGVLPGVDVVLVAIGTGLERRAVTNESGLYTFTNVPVVEPVLRTARIQPRTPTRSPVIRLWSQPAGASRSATL